MESSSSRNSAEFKLLAVSYTHLPEGQYELKIGAGDVDKNATGSAYAQMFNPTFLKKYQVATLPIEVKGDLTSLVVQVTDQPAAEAPTKTPTP